MLGYEGMYGGSAEQETGEKLYPFQTSVTLVRLIRIYDCNICECNSILKVFKTIHLNYAKTNFLPKDILNNLIYGIMFVLLNNIFIVMCLHPGFIVFIVLVLIIRAFILKGSSVATVFCCK